MIERDGMQFNMGYKYEVKGANSVLYMQLPKNQLSIPVTFENSSREYRSHSSSTFSV